MLTNAIRTIPVLGLVIAPAGCVAEVDPSIPGADEPVAEAAFAVAGTNAMSHNALNLNALNLNALNLNALPSAGLAAIRDPGFIGDLAREALRYMVSCALRADQSFSFDWTGSDDVVHSEVYPGLLGLRPAWATGPLDAEGQRMVSACLAARVNYYRVPVLISARSLRDPLKTLVDSQELADYPDVEGAFWGNLFSATPFLNACYNSATVANSRDWQRDCAVGHLTGDDDDDDETVECGMIHIVGSCSGVCQSLNGAGQYYPSCIERPGAGSSTTKEVITTALP